MNVVTSKHMIVTLALLLVLVDDTSAFSPRPLVAVRATTALAEKKEGGFSAQVVEEANDALTSVGWAPPSTKEGELTSDDPFVRQIDASIQQDMGVGLEELLNPAKVSRTLCPSLHYSACRVRSHMPISWCIRLSIWNAICTICDWSWPVPLDNRLKQKAV